MSNNTDSQSKSNWSQAAYSWLMFMTSYYRRVGDLNLDIDEMMTLNTVVAHWLYKVNSKDNKSYAELVASTDKDIREQLEGSKLSILSIANILGQPKESTRRRVQKLIDFQLVAKDQNKGIIVGENYTKIVEKFGKQTGKELARLISNLSEINWVDEATEEKIN
tara:strand:- start:741 stop:1232 length:492 start_codon:yes stop_codon:yes gene_type:complete